MATRCSCDRCARTACGVGAHPLERGPEPRLLERLEQVVEGLDVERLERVALVRGDEDDGRPGLDRQGGRDVEAAGLGHLDVEEHHLGPHPVDRRDRLRALGALADELHVGVLGQEAAEPGARQRLVVHDEGANPGVAHDEPAGASRSGKLSVHTAPPAGAGASAKRCSRP